MSPDYIKAQLILLISIVAGDRLCRLHLRNLLWRTRFGLCGNLGNFITQRPSGCL